MDFLKWEYVGEIILGIAGLIKGGQWIGKYLEKKHSNKTAIELAGIEEDKELAEKYAEAMEEIQALQMHLEKAITSFKMLNTLLKDHFKDDPTMLELIEQAEETFKGSIKKK